MTEPELRAAVAACAYKYLGVKEGSEAHLGLLERYNAIRPLPRGYALTAKDPWCAAFVSAVGAELGLTGTLLPECSCARMLALYQAAGRWVEDDAYVPRPGDVIFYGWADGGEGDYRGAPDHVGLVADCDGAAMSVVEGNFRNAVTLRALPVNARYIRGYAVPDYAGACAEAENAPAVGADAPGGPPWPGAEAENPYPSPSGGGGTAAAVGEGEGTISSPVQDKAGVPNPVRSPSSAPFTDVPAGAWYAGAVAWAAAEGIVNGTKTGLFRPEAPCTRAEAVAMLCRAARREKANEVTHDL